MSSKLIFYYSSMNSGKSLTILTKNYMFIDKGFKTILMKPETDNRTSGISTRVGLSEKCEIIKENQLPSDIILKASKPKPDYVLVDEAQFLSEEQIWNLSELVDHWNIDVYCYGLKLNWKGDFFEGSGTLMKIADELIPIENFCKENKGAYAYFHIKNTDDPSTVETGYEDMYQTVSRKVWKKWVDSKDGS